MEKEEKTFVLFWRGSLIPEYITGPTIEKAFLRAGYNIESIVDLEYSMELEKRE